MGVTLPPDHFRTFTSESPDDLPPRLPSHISHVQHRFETRSRHTGQAAIGAPFTAVQDRLGERAHHAQKIPELKAMEPSLPQGDAKEYVKIGSCESAGKRQPVQSLTMSCKVLMFLKLRPSGSTRFQCFSLRTLTLSFL